MEQQQKDSRTPFFPRTSRDLFKEAAYNQWHEQSSLIKGQRTFSRLINAKFEVGPGVLCSGTIGGQGDCVCVCVLPKENFVRY